MNSELKLKKLYNEALDVLNIPEIPLSIDYIKNPTREIGYFQFLDYSDNPRPMIYVAVAPNDFVFDNLPLDIKFNDNFEVSIYVLFHELGHYFHWLKYPNHFKKFQNYYTKGNRIEKKVEKIANNIANILFKHYKKREQHVSA